MPRTPPVHDKYQVPCVDLAAVLVPILEELREHHEMSNTGHTQDAGPLAEIIFRAARYLGIEEKSIPRRLYAIRELQTFTNELDMADVLLLCVGLRIDETDIPTFPANLTTARCQVDANYPELGQTERRKLASSLYHFSQAYILESAEEKTHVYLEGQNEMRKARIARQKEAMAA